MPIQIDKKPGRKPLRRDGTEAVVKSSTETPPPPAPTTRVRMLRDIFNSKRGTFLQGKTYHLPSDVARHWVTSGLAEEDKSLDGAPETK